MSLKILRACFDPPVHKNSLDYITPVLLGKGELGLKSRDGFVFT